MGAKHAAENLGKWKAYFFLAINTKAKSMATLLQDDDGVQAWYLSSDGGQNDIAKEAYQEAVEYLKHEFRYKPQAIAWIEGRQSLNEIRIETQHVEAQYRAASAPKKTVLHCVRRISAWIMMYGQVLDVLAQNHPEYVSLAWGAAKFLLMGVLNHETLNTNISRALEDIANVLPRMELHAKLYPTERMKDSMARLYAHMLLFLRQTVKWFSRHSVGRATSLIISPFEIKYKGLVDRIRTCANAIDDEADAASLQGRDKGSPHRAHEMRLDEFDAKLDDIRIEIKGIRHAHADIRGPSQSHEAVWVSAPTPPILILQAGPRAQMNTKELAIEIIGILEPAHMAVAWHLADPAGQEKPVTTRTQVLRSLVFQIMNRTPDLLNTATVHLKAANFQSQHSERDWLDLLCVVVSQLPKCFLVVEDNCEEQGLELVAMLETVASRCQSSGNIVKIMVLTAGAGGADSDLAKNLSQHNKEVITTITVQKPPQPPTHLRRPWTRQNHRALAWARVKKHVSR
ncbi:hypothetical protein B0H66DRAFT_599433 [Apodospora peruviana]|uniref:DUF7708 domain-containing protein n=1 Tax=Apodospora peruviana TaxID=516989 RepID=A0AAE0MB69_9PEZI|nr:hypothetical protein B0H66DRAFT_599433 [Apodospora peruviana]